MAGKRKRFVLREIASAAVKGIRKYISSIETELHCSQTQSN